MKRVESLEQLEQRIAQLEEEREVLELFATIGELAGVLAHETADFLNALLLQVQFLESRLPPSQREVLEAIRRQGYQLSDLVNRFRDYKRLPSDTVAVCDLANIVRGVSEKIATSTLEFPPVHVIEEPSTSARDGITLALRLPPGSAWVRGRASEVRRLVRLLLTNSIRVTKPGGSVRVSVAVDEDGTRLQLEDDTPFLAPIDPENLFELHAPGREGADTFELATCQTLARRLKCTLFPGQAIDGLHLEVHFARTPPQNPGA